MKLNLSHSFFPAGNKAPYLMCFLVFLWILTFPVKGIFFQLCIYLLPLLVLAVPQTRNSAKEHLDLILFLSVCFCLPILLSGIWSVFYLSGEFTKGFFDAFWRLSFFPVVVGISCIFCAITIRQLQSFFVAVGVLFGSSALFALLFHISLNGRGYSLRAAGFIANQNPFGFLMATSALVALYRLLHAENKREIILFFLAGITLFSAMVLSGSRSSWLGILLALLLLFILDIDFLKKHFKGKTKYVVWFVIIFISVTGSLFLYHPFSSMVEGRIMRIGSGDIRLDIWSHYFELFKQHFVFGVPLNAENKYAIGDHIHGPHNMYLSALVQTGLIGLSGLSVCFFYIAKRIVQRCRMNMAIILPLFCLLCVYCFFNSSIFGNVMTQGVFALIFAMMMLDETSEGVQ